MEKSPESSQLSYQHLDMDLSDKAWTLNLQVKVLGNALFSNMVELIFKFAKTQ